MKNNSLLLIVVIVALAAAAVALPHSGAYFSDVQTTTCTVHTGVWGDAGTPKPSLSLDPDDAEALACANFVSHVIEVSNTGDEPKDLALNVTLNVTAVKGTQYVASVVYDSTVGDIPAGEAREFFLEIELNDGWESAEEGEEVKLRIEVTGEDNRPEHNIGRRAHFTIIKGCSTPADEVLSPTGA